MKNREGEPYDHDSYFYYYNEQTFSGILYHFQDKKCLELEWVEDARATGSVRYRTLDEVQKLSIKVNDVRQVYELDAEGR